VEMLRNCKWLHKPTKWRDKMHKGKEKEKEKEI
jgi:hypothetical protein